MLPEEIGGEHLRQFLENKSALVVDESEPVNVRIHGEAEVGIEVGDRRGQFREVVGAGLGGMSKAAGGGAVETVHVLLRHAEAMQQARDRNAPNGINSVYNHREVLGGDSLGGDQVVGENGVDVSGQRVSGLVAPHVVKANGSCVLCVRFSDDGLALLGR
jgi:hypothetical protein